MNIYMVKTALVHHIEDDPVYECKMYDEDNTYNDCIENELEVYSQIYVCCFFSFRSFQAIFLPLVGCVPIWFTDDINKTCLFPNLTMGSQVKFRNVLYVESVCGHHSKL